MDQFNVRSAWGVNPKSFAAAVSTLVGSDNTPDEDGDMPFLAAQDAREGYELMGSEIRSAFVRAYDQKTGRSHGPDTVRKLLRDDGPAGEFVRVKRGVRRTQTASIEAYAASCARERAEGIRARTGRFTDVSASDLST
jgi:hypothetical protein